MEDLSNQELYQETIKVIEPFFNEQLKRQTAKVVQSIELDEPATSSITSLKPFLIKKLRTSIWRMISVFMDPLIGRIKMLS